MAELITGVDFTSIPAADFEASVVFYGETLGLTRGTYMPERGFAEFQAGNLTLSLFRPEVLGMQDDVRTTPIALQVGDVSRARDELAAADVDFDGEITDTGVCHMAFLSDPHGNPLILHHRYAPRE